MLGPPYHGKTSRTKSWTWVEGLSPWGLKPGDRVAVFSENRPRWVIADQAIQACGAVGVPLYSTLTLEELSYMLGDSGARVAIVSTQQKLEMTLKAKSHGVPLEAVITMGPVEGQKPEGVYTFAEIIGIGKNQASLNNLEDRMSRVTPTTSPRSLYLGNLWSPKRRYSYPKKPRF